MARHCTPRTVFAAPEGRETVRFKNGNTADIITTIREADRWADATVQNAECLRGADDYETARNVWRFVKGNLRYKADRGGHERVKSPSALFAAGTGDCKSYSIAEAALLRALGFDNVFYRFAAYAPGDFTHVYVVLKYADGETILDAVHSKFDDQVPYTRARDYAATGGRKGAALAGLPRRPAAAAVRGTFSNVLTLVGLAAGLGLAYYLLSDND